MKISWFYPDFQGLESSFGPFKLVIGDAHRAPNISVTIGVKRFCPGFEVLKPILHGLGNPPNVQVSRFGPPKMHPNVQVSRFGPPKTRRFPG